VDILGLRLVPNVFTEVEEDSIVQRAILQLDDVCDVDNREKGLIPGRRRTSWFGYGYGRTASGERHSEIPLVWYRPVPPWLSGIGSIVRTALGVDVDFDSIALNENDAGGGIHFHVDSPYFADLIAIVGLNEDAVFDFVDQDRIPRASVEMPRRSIFAMMGGEPRYSWLHSVRREPARKNRRFSILFRSARSP
jgi:alkylated DNA repair dioxygenase AlkB